ncbi:hypothetical protein P0F32_003488 [Vibrio metschnikovii]|jgi:hypothetical protein|nr:hypothetical protein [Vibrio metschnikovii]
MNKNGFSLFEALLSVMVLGSISTGIILKEVENRNQNERLRFIDEAMSIVKAVDHRIAIDGYDPDLWTKLKWDNEEDIVNSLIKEDLTSQYHDKCEGGKWNPAISTENQTKLISCNLWGSRRNFGETIKAELREDSLGFIQGFDLLISFDDIANFKKYFRDIKYSLNQISVNPSQEISGIYVNSLVSASNGVDISSYECINDPLDCAIKLSLERSGGNEYIRADGGNSMIGEHLTFIESKGESPLKCVKWNNTKKDGSGIWTRELDSDCGIGIYEDTPVMVEVAADSGTFKHVLLDKECVVYQWNGSTVKDLGETSPCGMFNGVDGEIYQIVDNTISNVAVMNEAYINELNAETGKIKDLTVSVAKIDQIITPILNAEFVYISNQLQVSGKSFFDDEVEFRENVYFQTGTYFNGKMTAYDDVDVSKNLNVGTDLTVSGSSTMTGNASFNNDLTVKGSMILSKVITNGASCSPIGSIARDSSGKLYSCVGNKWTAPSVAMNVETGTSSISGLTSGKKYLVSVYGLIANRGTGGETLRGVRIYSSSNTVLASTPSAFINWPDGHAPQSATLLITAPSDGYIRATTDNGNAMTMVALQVD